MKSNTVRMLLGAAMATVVILGMWLVAATIGSDRSTTNLGNDRFEDIRAAQIITNMDNGGPVFYPDLTDRTRDIWVFHIGEDPLTGFIVMAARAPSSCVVQWDIDAGDFYDVCDASIRFPADGSGLAQYPVELSDGKLIIDLNFEDR